MQNTRVTLSEQDIGKLSIIPLHERLILILRLKKLIVWKINALIAIINAIISQP